MTDPWRYRCPNGHSCIVARIENSMHAPQEPEAKYYCKICQTSFDTPIDAKTGDKAL